MNKHTKTALIIAPFLAIGGYIVAGYYADIQINKERVLALFPQGQCQIKQGNCILSNGQLQIRLSQTAVGIDLATTHPIDHAVISLVDANNKEKLHRLKQTTNRLNWQLAASPHETRSAKTLRLLLTISKTSYLAEIVFNTKIELTD
jgi:hypothetical protein